jgi:6-phosphogluconolactonase
MTSSLPSTVRIGSLALLFGLAIARIAPAAPEQKSETVTVFVGTYTGGASGSKGIYRFEFELATGKPGEVTLAAATPSPSFLAIDPSRRFLYAVAEVDSLGGERGGAVAGFAIDPKTSALTPLNTQSSGGAGPCHLVADKAGKNVLVANYGGGSTAVLPIEPDGQLKPRSSFIQHTGSSVNKSRQKEPHAHSVNLDAANRFAFVADLGLDKVLVYKFDPTSGTVAPNDPPSASVAPGAGPRHFAFHPSGRYAYVINELNSTITAFSYDAMRGVLSEIQSISTLPEGVKVRNSPADVQVHASGRFLYGSNRGHDSIVACAIDPQTGKLTRVANQADGIKNPRNFAMDPTGTFLLVANQDLDSIVVFKIDMQSGALVPTGQSVKAPKPVCLKFWAPAS